MTGSAKQSIYPQRKCGLLRRCAPGNDGTTIRAPTFAANYADARPSRPCVGFDLAVIPEPAVNILLAAPCPFSEWPFSVAPFASPLSLRRALCLALAFSLAFAAFALRFSVSFNAFRSALALRRSFSARASARFFLRFFSQAAHLQPIGFR